MATTVDAIYEDGVLRLLTPLPLPEHTPVQVTVDLPADTVQDDPRQRIRTATGYRRPEVTCTPSLGPGHHLSPRRNVRRWRSRWPPVARFPRSSARSGRSGSGLLLCRQQRAGQAPYHRAWDRLAPGTGRPVGETAPGFAPAAGQPPGSRPIAAGCSLPGCTETSLTRAVRRAFPLQPSILRGAVRARRCRL